jgi:carboxypeptidase Q
MIASPNYANLIYDGDGSSFGLIGPPGSAEIEKLFQGYFERLGQAHFPSPFNGRSDYQAFILNGIPAGGIFSGADGIKTEEQARACGGQAGIRFDPNYHGPGDNMTNLNHDAFLRNARGAAFALASYARSVHSLPPKEPPEQALKRWIPHLDDHSDCSDHCGQCTI